MTGLLGKEQECCTDMAHLVEVTRKRSSRLGGKYCSDIHIWTPWPNDRRQMSQPQLINNCVITRDSHMDGLTGSLRQLSQQAESEDFTLIEERPQRSISRDGYGFRKSGISTPVSTPDGPQHPQLANELVPDPNGLGWPGVSSPTLQC